MKDEYIIINKTTLLKRMEELEDLRKNSSSNNNDYYQGQIKSLKEILSQSTPLIPKIEKAFDAAREFDSIDGVVDINIVLNMPSHDLSDLQEKTTKEDYISNLKVDI